MTEIDVFDNNRLDAPIRATSSYLAIAYCILDALAVDLLIDELAVGNGEPETTCDPDDSDYPDCPVHGLQAGLYETMFFFHQIPVARPSAELVTMAALAAALKNTQLDELRRIRDALNGHAATIALARPRLKPVEPRAALLAARLATIAQFWADWQGGAPLTGNFADQHGALVPEPNTGVAFAVECLAEAKCPYTVAEIAAALG